MYIEQIRDGRRIKSIGTIHKSRWGPTTQCVEYQLLDLETGRLLQNGTWLRQKDLRYVPAGKMVSLSTQNQANVKQNREPASAVNAKETKSETSKIQDSPPSEVEASSSTTPSVSVEAEVPSFISTGAYLKPSSAVVIDSNQPVLPPPQVNLDELELDDHIGASTKRSLVLGHVDATWSEERPLGVNHVQNDNETNDSVAPSRDVLEQTNKKTATNLTVDQVSQWVSARKKRMKTRAAITEDYLTTLAGRDQVIAIRSFWSCAKECRYSS